MMKVRRGRNTIDKWTRMELLNVEGYTDNFPKLSRIIKTG